MEDVKHLDMSDKLKYIERAHRILDEIEKKYNAFLSGEHIMWEQHLLEIMEIKSDFGCEVEQSYLEDALRREKKELLERMEKYKNKYIRKDSDIMMDFDTLINKLNQNIPLRFKDNPVEERYFEYPFFHSMLNFNPYRNGGNLLPSHFAFVDKDSDNELSCLKGETYIVSQLYYINKWHDYDVIAPLFLIIFLSEFVKNLIHNNVLDSYSVSCLIIHAKDLLQRHCYDLPDYRYKSYIPSYFYHSTDAKEYYDKLNNTKFQNEEELASFIALFFDIIYEPYQMCYFAFSPEEQKRAEAIERDAYEAYGEWINSIRTGKITV